MALLPVRLPETNRPVRAVIKNSFNWLFKTEVILVAVAEDDCNWRFHEDKTELDFSWDVIYWEYIE